MRWAIWSGLYALGCYFLGYWRRGQHEEQERQRLARWQEGDGPRYTVVICGFCGEQAQWLPLDRLGSSWQCNNRAHGYKYLSADQVETIEVIPR